MIARLFNTVGPRQSGQYGMVIPRFVEAALAGQPLEVYGDGTQTRCFCHVADMVRALQALIAEPATAGGIFNVGSTERVRIVDLAKRVIEKTGSGSEIVFVPYEEVFERGIEEECSTVRPRSTRSRMRSAGSRASTWTGSSTT